MLPLALYGLGLCSLTAADILVTRFLSSEEISDWAQVRALVGLCGVFCLVGLDQVLVRSPQSSARLLRTLSIQIPILGLGVGVAIWKLGLSNSVLHAIGLAVGSAGTLALFQYFRSHGHKVKSQLAQQGWKIAALALVGGALLSQRTFSMEGAITILLLGSLALMLMQVARFPPTTMAPQSPEPLRALYAIGSRFMATSLFLALSIYAEQLIVNRLGSAQEAALYFTSATYFLFPMSFLNGYLAFLIGPWLRDNHQRFSSLLARRWWQGVFLAAGYTVGLSWIGWMGWQLIEPSVGAIDPILQILFGFSCFTRTLYLVPSGYIGIFGRPRQHDWLIIAQVISAAIVVGLFLVLKNVGVTLVHAVALCSVLNWFIRFITGYLIMLMIQRSRLDEPRPVS